MTIRFIRLPEVKELTSFSRSVVYASIEKGTLTPPIKVGRRANAWPEYEIQAINAARVAGKSEPELQELVTELIEKRREAA
ncbi:MAG: AlpA family phage regulatory protein [Sedimenticola sp.]